jgi:hypothetical protein
MAVAAQVEAEAEAEGAAALAAGASAAAAGGASLASSPSASTIRSTNMSREAVRERGEAAKGEAVRRAIDWVRFAAESFREGGAADGGPSADPSVRAGAAAAGAGVVGASAATAAGAVASGVPCGGWAAKCRGKGEAGRERAEVMDASVSEDRLDDSSRKGEGGSRVKSSPARDERRSR